MDPNLDQTHPDPGAMVRLLCAANRQPNRGRFKSRILAESILGRRSVATMLVRGDLVPDGPDGRLYADGWDEWQEGDWTVGERQRRIRAKRHKVTVQTLPDRDTSVTGPVSDRDRPSEASRRLGVKALDVPSEHTDGAPARLPRDNGQDDDVVALQLLAEQLTRTPYAMPNVHGGLGAKAVAMLHKHGPAAVESEWRRIAEEEGGLPTLRQLVLGADNALNAISGPESSSDRKAREKREAADFVAQANREAREASNAAH